MMPADAAVRARSSEPAPAASPRFRRGSAGSAAGVALLLLLAAGCASSPLGEDWERLDAPGRDARALATLRELFAGGVTGGGTAFRDRDVLAVTREGIRYTTADGAPSALLWGDVDAVEGHVQHDLPARPESVYVYLRPGSPSTREAHDQVEPLLANVGISRPYLPLRDRPRGARARLVAALEHLRADAPASVTSATSTPDAPPPTAGPAPPPDAPPATAGPAPPPGDLDATEARLRRLRAWHEQGLITDEDYERERREALSGAR